MKKLLSLSLIAAFLFTACSTESDNPENTDPTKQVYQTTTFHISAPQDWEALDQNNFTSNVPNSTVVAFRETTRNEIFTPNVNVTENSLDQSVTSLDLAKSTIQNNSQNLLSYTLTSEEPYSFADGDEIIQTTWIEFQGKQKSDSPIISFKQLFVVKDGLGYTITGAYLPNEDESVVKQIEEMLNSFTLK